jgi:two-component system OmpR family response regulator
MTGRAVYPLSIIAELLFSPTFSCRNLWPALAVFLISYKRIQKRGPLMRVLLIEDSVRLQEALAESLRDAGYLLDIGSSVADFEVRARTANYDFIVLDLGLPDGDGLAMLRALRSDGMRTPVLVITARGTVDDRIGGLDSGADDYLSKPFNHDELLARIRAVRRRSPELRGPVVKVGNTVLNEATGEISTDHSTVHLRPSERRLVTLLMRKHGRLLTKETLEESLSEFGRERSTNAIEILMSRSRKALSDAGANIVIETVRGLGYILSKPEQ